MKKPIAKDKLHKLIPDLDIQDYHQRLAGYSSSQFKDLLDDEDVFIAKHIEKTIEREESAAFDVGTYFHTGVLEPHKLKQDCVVYPGKIRRGKDWETFKKKNASRTIVTQSQKEQAEGLVRAVKNSPVAQEYLDGVSEVSLFIRIIVKNGNIYAPYFGKRLTRTGWVKDLDKLKDGFEMVVKVRADKLGESYVSDLKSTSGNAKSNRAMRSKISDYQYDLSAALYLDMFSLLMPSVREFVWIFASKDLFNSKSYRASPKNVLVGRAKYMKAMIKMADCAANNWKSYDYLDMLEPLPHELEFLVERDTDLL